MKGVILMAAAILAAGSLYGQTVQTITADSVKITNTTGSAELILENSTRAVPGYLFNKGNGRTVFKRGLEKLNDSTYVVGADTLRVPGGPFVSLSKSETIPSVKVFNPQVVNTRGFASGTVFNAVFNAPVLSATLLGADFRAPVVTNASGVSYTAYAARFQGRVLFAGPVNFPGGTLDVNGLRTNNILPMNEGSRMNLYKPPYTNAGELMRIVPSATITTTGSELTAGTVFRDTVTFTNGVQDYAQIRAVPALVQQGAANGPLRGLYLNPVLTGVSDFRGIEVHVNENEGYAFYAGGTAPSSFGGVLRYSGNFASRFNSRSLVDKGYVDSLAGGGAGGWSKQQDSGYLYYNGNVGIGGYAAADNTIKLAVHGTVFAKRIRISQSGAEWPDYVFDSSYVLPDMNYLQKYVQENRHLPGVPSAAEVKKEGVDVAAMQAKILEKVEELTLLVIEQDKTIQEQAEQIKLLKQQLKQAKK